MLQKCKYQIKYYYIYKQFLPCSLTILDGDGMDFLFGLDMLKRY